MSSYDDKAKIFPPPPEHPSTLLSGLHSAWVRQLRTHFHDFNEEYLGGVLRLPLFLISRATDRLGHWSGQNRSISISEHHILSHPWEEVLDTLRHEMAHQYVEEVLFLPHAPPHGEPFLRACRLLRCDPSPAARVDRFGPLDGSTDERDRILVRIKELLALAGSPNEHEAANAMRMAQRFLLKYNLDLSEVDGKSNYTVRHLGTSAPRIQEYQYCLSSILQEHFFVLPIWVPSYDPRRDREGRVLQICGTPENLEMASYVHDYVLHTAESLWNEKRRSRSGLQGTKLQYLAGLLRGFQDKLRRQKEELQSEHGLIWTGDSELYRYYRELHPRVRSVSTSGVSRSAEYRAGVEDGRQITIRRGVGGPATNRGRAITGPDS